MEINIIQVILLAVLTFIMAIDQFSLTEIISRPIINCTLIGLILGDLNTGLVLGGTYELMMVGNMPVGGAQPPNAIIGGIVGMIFAVRANMDINAALGAAIVFSVFGGYAVTLTFTVMSGLMTKADKAAEEANPAGIVQVNFISMGLLGALFAIISVVAYVGGTAVAPALEAFSTNFSWFMGGLSVAGGMMRFVGFAILMKIMLSGELWGFLLAGFAGAIVLGTTSVSSATLVLLAFIGVAIAIFDYTTNVRIKENAGSGNGGFSDGI